MAFGSEMEAVDRKVGHINLAVFLQSVYYTSRDCVYRTVGDFRGVQFSLIGGHYRLMFSDVYYSTMSIMHCTIVIISWI